MNGSRLLAASRVLAALRVGTIAVGLAGHVAVATYVASLQPPSPTGDGVPAGFAFAFALVGTAAAGVVTLVGYGLPPGEGRLRVGPLVDRTAPVRLATAGAVSIPLGLVCMLGIAFVASGSAAVVVWVFGLGLVVGGLVGLVLAGIGRAVGHVVRRLGPPSSRAEG